MTASPRRPPCCGRRWPSPAAVDPDGYKRNVLRLVFESYVPTVPLSLAALVYGVAGVVFGSFLGHVALAALGGIGGRLGRIGRRHTPWYVPPRETRLRY
jgi:hypothetical protein